MKDDKNFVYIKITREDFPRIQIVRQIENDGAKYFGPKSAAHKVKDTFKLLKKLFPFRHCNLNIKFLEKAAPEHKVAVSNKVIKYPCLDYFIKRCPAPCIGKIAPAEYLEAIQNIENFLAGKTGKILDELKGKMHELAATKEFEKAAKIRDKIQKIQDILEKQKVQSPEDKERDIVNYYVTGNKAYFNLFQVRGGKLIGQENFIFSAQEIEDGSKSQEALSAFLSQYYLITNDYPQEILLPHEAEDFQHLKVKILYPQRGKKHKLLEMSLKNAKIFADRNKPSWKEESELSILASEELAKILKMQETPKRIECYDISHLDGKNTVGSMIVFEKGVPKKEMYRKFKIRTVKNKADDYRCLEEVLTRRFSRIENSPVSHNYKFKKATKKHLDQLEHLTSNSAKKPKTEKNSGSNIYILESAKKIAASINLKIHSAEIAELNKLWTEAEKAGEEKPLKEKIIKDSIKKMKQNRIYMLADQNEKDFFQPLGFEEIRKIPAELEESLKNWLKKAKTPVCLLHNKIKNREDSSFSKIPDLVVIDGGKGQLSAANKVFKVLKLKIPCIALAKRLEEIFIPEMKNSLILPANHEALKLLRRARDEAHRFAITFNRQLRSKSLRSPER